MFEIIIVSHGGFASGLRSSMEMIAGEQRSLYDLSLSSDETASAFQDKINTLVSSLKKDDGLLVLTDILGGTPTLVAMKVLTELNQLSPFDFECISGVNLPILIDIVIKRESTNLEDCVYSVIQNAEQSIVNVKKMLFSINELND